MLNFKIENDANDFFKRFSILISSIATMLSVIASLAVFILHGQKYESPLQNLISGLLAFDIFSLAYSVSMFMFFVSARKNKDCKLASLVLYISTLIQAISVFVFFGVLIIYSAVNKVTNPLIYQVLVFFGVALELYILPQFGFSSTIRKYIKLNKKSSRWSNLAAFLNYFVAFLMIVPIFTNATSFWNIVLIIVTTLSYLCKGLVCSKYRFFIKGSNALKMVSTPGGNGRRLPTKRK